jgi:tRNA modification GTPase
MQFKPRGQPSHQVRETFAAALTPAGRGAVATVAVWGPRALEAAATRFRPAGAALDQRQPGAIVFGRWGTGKETAGEEVVVARRENGSIEIHCHGGVAAVDAILASLIDAGCKRVDWKDWLHEKEPDRLAHEALEALAEARTERVAAVLLDQYRGALRGALVEILGLLAAGHAERARSRLAALAKAARFGLRLTDPWRIVLAGRPNAGKSTLLNALVGFERAIADPQPGTTRDVVTASAAIGGLPVELADTAGLREAEHDIERAGVERAKAELRRADVVVLVRDASSHDEYELPLVAGARIIVYNKCDLISADARASIESRGDGLPVSARTGEGVCELIAAIEYALVPNPPPAGAPVPFTARQAEAIERALAAIDAGDPNAAVQLLGAYREPT